MRITCLELENIKSYVRLTVPFTAGLNAVCGANGSGKTTVLEAIGYALFDYLPYTQQAFVREGQKSGTIRVRLLARDEREYEVVRRVGSGGSYYVSDLATGMRIADGSKDVPVWIQAQALDIDGQADLRALFKNAVGVPQGLITADFQSIPSQRKPIFDPLLRVDEYQKANENLRETVTHVRELSHVVKEDIARLETDTERIPEMREEQADLAVQIAESEGRLATLTAERAVVGDQKRALDTVAVRLQELRLELQKRTAEVEAYSARLSEQDKAVQAAEEARRIMEASEAGWKKVEDARTRLRQLEEMRRERDVLREDLSAAKSARQGIYGTIQHLDLEIRQAAEAADQAAMLLEAVARQEELDRQLQEARLKLRDAKQLDGQIEKARETIKGLERSCLAREAHLTQAREALGHAEKLAEVRQKLQERGEHLATLDLLKEQAKVVEVEGKRLRQQHDLLAGQVRRRQELLRRAEQLGPEAEGFEDLAERQQDLRDERTRIMATIEYQHVAREALESLRCPLLELQCPVVETDRGMLHRLGDQASALRSRVDELSVELQAVETRATRAKEAAQEQQRVLLQAAQLEGSERQFAEVTENLDSCRSQYGTLAQALSGEQNLRREQAELTEEVRRLEKAAELTSQLEPLQEAEKRQLDHRRHELEDLEGRRATLGAAVEEAATLTAELEALGDPRRKQQNLLAVASRKPELEARVAEQHVALSDAADRVKALMGKLEAFTMLDAELQEQREIEERYREDYQRYLGNRDEAMRLVERHRAREATRQALQAAAEAEREAKRRLEESEAQYDAATHLRVTQRWEDLGREVATEEERHANSRRALARVEEELAYLRRQEERLAARLDELAELERVGRTVAFIRDTIKSAGPAITETLLANISQVANDIYSEIMDDHASELRWERDYEIVVQRGPELRKFAQLSGGEQMSAALAVRLALLKEMSDINFAFFDEPTQNMDADRRSNLADQIQAVRGFEQLIVISHDDTFEHHTENLVRLRKVNDETQLDEG